jgi:hypothetical protein
MGGKRYGNYVFTNISSKPCRMSGFPVFTLLDKSGRVMQAVKVTYDLDTASGDRDSSVKDTQTSSVILQPKQTAWFQIFYNDGFGFDLKKPVPTSAKVKIRAPQTTRTFVIKSSINAYKNLEISAIRKGLPQ